MKSVFISGSISVKNLKDEVKKSLLNIISQNMQVFIGDAKGVDSLAQEFLKEKRYTNATICTIYENPRHIKSNLFKIKNIEYDKTIKSEREKQIFKDSYMSLKADYSFVIWDGKSKEATTIS